MHAPPLPRQALVQPLAHEGQQRHDLRSSLPPHRVQTRQRVESQPQGGVTVSVGAASLQRRSTHRAFNRCTSCLWGLRGGDDLSFIEAYRASRHAVEGTTTHAVGPTTHIAFVSRLTHVLLPGHGGLQHRPERVRPVRTTEQGHESAVLLEGQTCTPGVSMSHPPSTSSPRFTVAGWMRVSRRAPTWHSRRWRR